jgi:hypothetical protein
MIKSANPQIQYLLSCSQNWETPLPILDKIVRNTLVLHDYTLSEGHCIGLAKACSVLDTKKVNGILLSNCGISG